MTAVASPASPRRPSHPPRLRHRGPHARRDARGHRDPDAVVAADRAPRGLGPRRRRPGAGRALPRPRLRELAELRRRHGLRPLLVRRPGYRAGPRRGGPCSSAARTARPGAGWSGSSSATCASWPTSTWPRSPPGRGGHGHAGHRRGLRRLHARQQGHVLRHAGPAGREGAGRRGARAGLGDHPPRRRPVRRQRAGAAGGFLYGHVSAATRREAGGGQRRRPGAARAAARADLGRHAGAGRRDRGPPGDRAARRGRRRAGRRGRDRAGGRAGRRRADGRPARPAPARRLRHQPLRRPDHAVRLLRRRAGRPRL